MAGLRAWTSSDFTSAGPRITRRVGSPVWLAATKVTSSGSLVLIGGCFAPRFWGICWSGSSPWATSPFWTTTWLGVTITLTRVETAGRGSFGRVEDPQPAAASAKQATTAPATAALALPRTIVGRI